MLAWLGHRSTITSHDPCGRPESRSLPLPMPAGSAPPGWRLPGKFLLFAVNAPAPAPDSSESISILGRSRPASDPTLPVALVLCCAGFALASPRAVRCQHPPAFGSPAARVRQSWWLAEPAGNSRAVSRARYQYPAPAYRELVTYPIGQRPGGSRGPSDEPTENGRRRRRPKAEAKMHPALLCA